MFTKHSNSDSAKDAFALHWSHVLNHYETVRRKESHPAEPAPKAVSIANTNESVRCRCPSNARVSETNIVFHLNQMTRFVVEEAEFAPSEKVSRSSFSIPAGSAIEFVLERRVLPNLVALALLDRPRGLLLPVLHFVAALFANSEIAVLCLDQHLTVRKPVLDLISLTRARLHAVEDFSFEEDAELEFREDAVFPYCKALLDLIVIIVMQMQILDPLLIILFLETSVGAQLESQATSGALMSSKSYSEVTLNDHSRTASLLPSETTQKLNSKCQHMGAQSSLVLLEACLDLALIPDPLGSMAQKAVLDVFNLFLALADDKSDEANAIISRFCAYVLEASYLFEAVELNAKYSEAISTNLTDNSAFTIVEHVVLSNLWAFLDSLSLILNKNPRFSSLNSRLEDLLHVFVGHCFKFSEYEALSQPANRKTALFQSLDQLLTGLHGNGMKASLEKVFFWDFGEGISGASMFADEFGIVEPKFVVNILSDVTQFMNEASVPSVLGFSNIVIAGSSTSLVSNANGWVDRLLRTSYLGSDIPSTLIIQKDLDPYFFEALERRDGTEESQNAAPRLSMEPSSRTVWTRLLENCIHSLGLLSMDSKLKLSGIIHWVVWKSVALMNLGNIPELDQVNPVEKVVAALEFVGKRITENIGKDTLDAVLHEMWLAKGCSPSKEHAAEQSQAENISFPALSKILNIPADTLESIFVLVEISREVLAVVLAGSGAQL